MAALLFLGLVHCGEDPPAPAIGSDPHQDYEDENVTVLGGDDQIPIATGQPTEGGCLQITTEECVPVDRTGKYCKEGSGPVDVIVVDGEVVEVICYEDTDTTEGPTQVVTSSSGDVMVAQQDNGAVVTFGEETDGVPIEGDLTVDGNGVTVYGNGPDKTIIDGDLLITGNNARVRGVRVMGDVIIDLNTAAFVLSHVDGNLEVRSNNSLVASDRTFGNFVVTGNNTILVQNEVGGEWMLDGAQGSVCQSNVRWENDAPADPLECP